jgi:hypothetical protein
VPTKATQLCAEYNATGADSPQRWLWGVFLAVFPVGRRSAGALAGKTGDKMDIIVEIHPESGYLLGSVMGEFSLQEAKRTFLEMLEAVARHQVKKVLFDGRRLTGDPETLERFYYGKFAADAVLQFKDRGVSPATQFAYVLQEPVLDPQRFGETVAVNRGMLVKAFDNLEDALGWLGIAPANKPAAGGG